MIEEIEITKLTDVINKCLLFISVIVVVCNSLKVVNAMWDKFKVESKVCSIKVNKHNISLSFG